jgi:hypothetical protein
MSKQGSGSQQSNILIGLGYSVVFLLAIYNKHIVVKKVKKSVYITIGFIGFQSFVTPGVLKDNLDQDGKKLEDNTF